MFVCVVCSPTHPPAVVCLFCVCVCVFVHDGVSLCFVMCFLSLCVVFVVVLWLFISRLCFVLGGIGSGRARARI